VLFMVIERFRGQDAKAVYRRFRDQGRPAPKGLTYVGSWVEASCARCFQLMACDDARLPQRWAAWQDLVELEFVPVVPGAETAEALVSLLRVLRRAAGPMASAVSRGSRSGRPGASRRGPRRGEGVQDKMPRSGSHRLDPGCRRILGFLGILCDPAAVAVGVWRVEEVGAGCHGPVLLGAGGGWRQVPPVGRAGTLSSTRRWTATACLFTRAGSA